MRAITWQGRHDVRVQEAPEPRLEASTDAIVEVAASSICGSDLHLYEGLPRLEKGDVMGHEAVGIVRELGEDVLNLAEGDRVVVPVPIACGACDSCRDHRYAACLTPNAARAPPHGGISGAQAEYLRVPYAHVGPRRVPHGVSDEAALVLADALPTGYEAVAAADAGPGRAVAVFGCGPVGLMAVASAKTLLGAEQVIAVDRVPERLRLARKLGADATVNFEQDDDPPARVRELTDGAGAHVSVDAVGLAASSPRRIVSTMEKLAGALLLQTGALTALRWTVDAVRVGGAVSVPGAYGHANAQMFPWGTLWEKNARVTMGETHVQAHLPRLLEVVERGVLDPTPLVTHRARLEDGPRMYEAFARKEDGCVKVALRP